MTDVLTASKSDTILEKIKSVPDLESRK